MPAQYQSQLFSEHIAPHMRPGTALVIASGYNIAFNLLPLPGNIDVVMVAPRMIGAGVRERYRRGEPYPCFISVERDVTGEALPLALSIPRGIGATRGGPLQSSARDAAPPHLFTYH